MKVTFLGVGSEFSYQNANSNILVESGDIKLCIDCGRSAFVALEQYGLSLKDLTHVLITHTHADCVSGLEEIAFVCKFVHQFKIKLVATSSLLERLWANSLRGGLEYIEEIPGDLRPHVLTDYFAVDSVDTAQWNFIDKASSFAVYLHPTDHVKGMESYGVEVKEIQEEQQKQFFFSGDTKFNPTLIKQCATNNKYLFHDCQLSEQGGENKLGWHASYRQLCQLPKAVKKKMWLYRYGNDPLPNAREDGFGGFAQQLQTFVL